MRVLKRSLAAGIAAIPAVLLPTSGCRQQMPPMTLAEIREAYCADPQWARFAGIDVLTVDRAQEIAEANNPDFQAAELAVGAARMRYFQSLGAYLPELSLHGELEQSILDRDQIVNPFPTTVPFTDRFTTAGTLRGSWLLFDGCAREMRALAGRSGVKLAAARRADALRLLRRAVACAYYDVLLATELERIAGADIEFRRSCFDQATVRYRAGFIARRDWLGFRIDLNRALDGLVRARELRATGRYALAALMGYPDGELPPHVALTPIADGIRMPEFDLAFYLDEALARRPDLRGARQEIDIARYRKYGALGAYLPAVSLFGEAGGSTRSARYRGYEAHHAYWRNMFFRYGVQADWMIFDGFARFNRYRELQELQSEARRRFAAKEIEVLAEVGSAYAVLCAAAERARLRREMMEWVFEQRRLVAAEYWEGNVTITRLRGAQDDLVDAESGLAVALIEMHKAGVQLAAAVSGPAAEETESTSTGIVPLDALFDRLEQNGE